MSSWLRGEVLTAVAAYAGWCLVTLAIVHWTTPWVWPLSGGLLLLSLVGWRLIAVVAFEGLYALSRDEEDGDAGS